MNRCDVSRKTGGRPSIFERGSMRSIGSSCLPQLSHWSPRASGKPQFGHVPSMYRSGSVCPVVAEKAPSAVSLDDEALLPQRPEQVADDPVVVQGGRAREEVVREPEAAEVLADDGVVAVDELTRRHALAIGGDHDRRAVLVRPGHHQHVVAAQAVIAREHIGRDSEPGHMPDVAWAVRVRPRHRDEDLPGGRHRRSSYEPLPAAPCRRARTAPSGCRDPGQGRQTAATETIAPSALSGSDTRMAASGATDVSSRDARAPPARPTPTTASRSTSTAPSGSPRADRSPPDPGVHSADGVRDCRARGRASARRDTSRESQPADQARLDRAIGGRSLGGVADRWLWRPVCDPRIGTRPLQAVRAELQARSRAALCRRRLSSRGSYRRTRRDWSGRRWRCGRWAGSGTGERRRAAPEPAAAGGGDGWGAGCGDRLGRRRRNAWLPRGGSSDSGSTYPSGCAAMRTPRWTYGRSHSGVPLTPARATRWPSTTTSPFPTRVSPRCVSVTEYPSGVRMVTVLPLVGTVPANVTVPAAGARIVLARVRGDVDAAVLARRVRVGAEREGTEHLAARRPRPGQPCARRRKRRDETPPRLRSGVSCRSLRCSYGQQIGHCRDRVGCCQLRLQRAAVEPVARDAREAGDDLRRDPSRRACRRRARRRQPVRPRLAVVDRVRGRGRADDDGYLTTCRRLRTGARRRPPCRARPPRSAS